MSKRPGYFYSQSGVIPFRKRKGKLELLMVTSTKKKRWIIPKGVKEPHLSSRESAIKEAWEEAGVEGRVLGNSLGIYSYVKREGGEDLPCVVAVFAVKVKTLKRKYPESNERRRAWYSRKKAELLKTARSGRSSWMESLEN